MIKVRKEAMFFVLLFMLLMQFTTYSGAYTNNPNHQITVHSLAVPERTKLERIFSSRPSSTQEHTATKLEPNIAIQQDSITYLAPDIITSGAIPDFSGMPVTNDVFGVNWSQAVQDQGLSQNGNISVNIDFYANFSESSTILATDLQMSVDSFTPEWSQDVYLLGGSKVTGKLNWSNPDANFDLLITPASGPVDRTDDIFGCYSCTNLRPEQFSGYVPSSGMYTVYADFFYGNVADTNITVDFTATKNIVSTSQLFTNDSLEFSMVDVNVTQGQYSYLTEYTSDLNETLSYNSTFIFDNHSPNFVALPWLLDPSIQQDTYYIYFDSTTDTQIPLCKLWDPLSYNYTLYINSVLSSQVLDQTGFVTLSLDVNLWPNQLDEVEFTIIAEDYLGQQLNYSGTVIRPDTKVPEFSNIPSQTPYLKVNETLQFAWTITDAYSFGTYAIKVGFHTEETGVWTKDVPITFNYTFDKEKDYTVTFTATDAFNLIPTFARREVTATITNTISISVSERPPTVHNYKYTTEKNPLPIFPFLASFVCITVLFKRKLKFYY